MLIRKEEKRIEEEKQSPELLIKKTLALSISTNSFLANLIEICLENH